MCFAEYSTTVTRCSILFRETGTNREISACDVVSVNSLKTSFVVRLLMPAYLSSGLTGFTSSVVV